MAGIVFSWARLVVQGRPVDQVLVVTPTGLVDVTSRCQFRAAALSMVVTPERRMSAIQPFRKGLGWLAVMSVKWFK